MNHNIKSLRAFLGSKDFNVSRNFYRDWGFEEATLGSNLSVFNMGDFAFYLQDAYVKDWVDNTMIFMEVENIDAYYDKILGLNLSQKYPSVKIKPAIAYDWGKEFFVHDPAGILWHIGEFYN